MNNNSYENEKAFAFYYYVQSLLDHQEAGKENEKEQSKSSITLFAREKFNSISDDLITKIRSLVEHSDGDIKTIYSSMTSAFDPSVYYEELYDLLNS